MYRLAEVGERLKATATTVLVPLVLGKVALAVRGCEVNHGGDLRHLGRVERLRVVAVVRVCRCRAPSPLLPSSWGIEGGPKTVQAEVIGAEL